MYDNIFFHVCKIFHIHLRFIRDRYQNLYLRQTNRRVIDKNLNMIKDTLHCNNNSEKDSTHIVFDFFVGTSRQQVLKYIIFSIFSCKMNRSVSVLTVTETVNSRTLYVYFSTYNIFILLVDICSFLNQSFHCFKVALFGGYA